MSSTRRFGTRKHRLKAAIVTERYCHSLFCDDIRQETTGKWIYIGVYQGQMLVQSFPINLPSLSVVITCVTPADRPFQKLKIRVLKDDEELITEEVPVEALRDVGQFAIESNTNKREDLISVVEGHLRISPLQADAPCALKVRVDTEDGEINGSGLDIALMPRHSGNPPG